MRINPGQSSLPISDSVEPDDFSRLTAAQLLDALEMLVGSLRQKNAALEAELREARARVRSPARVVPLREPERDANVHWSFPVKQLPAETLADVFGVRAETMREWLSGRCPVPSWVVPSVKFLLEVEGGRHGITKTTGGRNPHPFSRIEEL